MLGSGKGSNFFARLICTDSGGLGGQICGVPNNGPQPLATSGKNSSK